MKELPYKNREIDEMFDDIKSSLTRIETQTTRTNGRVNKLENFRAYIIGFCACITVVLIPIALALAEILILHKP